MFEVLASTRLAARFQSQANFEKNERIILREQATILNFQRTAVCSFQMVTKSPLFTYFATSSLVLKRMIYIALLLGSLRNDNGDFKNFQGCALRKIEGSFETVKSRLPSTRFV